MPRELANPRQPISRNGSRQIETGRSDIGSRVSTTGRRTTTSVAGNSQTDFGAINTNIRANVGAILGNVPGSGARSLSGTGNVIDEPRYGSSNPFEILADVLGRQFGSSVYNPPLESQAFGYGTSGGTNFTLILILGAIGIAVYFFYFRNK